VQLRRIAALLLVACVLVCNALRPAHAADAPSFEAMGRAPISGGDRVRARQRALDEAFQRVVEAAVAALLGPETLTKRAADLRLKIMPKAKSYITTYRVIEEGEIEAGIFDVHVSAEVAADRLVRDLSTPGRDPKLPTLRTQPGARIVLCITSDAGPALPRLAAALRSMLTARAIEAVPTERCADDELVRATQSASACAALVAEVTGGAATPIRGTALVGREGKLVLHMHEVDGRRSVQGQGESAGYGATSAAAADELAMHALAEAGASIEGALASLGGATAKGIVTVKLVGVSRLGHLASIRSAIERLSGIESVEPRRFLPGVPGTIELGVHTALPPRAVADAISRVGAAYSMRARELEGAVVVDVTDKLDAPAPDEGAPR